MKYVSIADMSLKAWEGLSGTAPTFSNEKDKFYVFTPVHGDNSAYLVLVTEAAFDPENFVFSSEECGVGTMVRVKFTSRTTGISASLPKKRAMAVAEENEVADMIGFILDDLRGEEQSAPYTISNTSKNEDAVFVFCYRIDDTRVMNITAQVFVTPIVPAAKRNIHQQSMLEGISQMRKQITKAGMRPYLKGRAPLENEIFASQECDEEDVGRGVTAMLSQDGRGMSELVAAHIKLPGADTGKSFIQPKLDGIRVLSVRRLGEVIMFTKGGKIGRASCRERV